MDLTRSFIEKIEEMTTPETIEIEGMEYSKDDLKVVMPPVPFMLCTQSLKSIVDYLASGADGLDSTEVIIHVVDPTTVAIYSELHYASRVREKYIQAHAMLPEISFNRYMDREKFNIMIQACFEDQGDRAAVLSVIGNICVDQNSGVEVSDDGVTQNVEAKTGAVLKTRTTVPNPVYLAPFRTFTEVDQPESAFVLRINQDMEVGLFEADGGAWKQEAMNSIREYLEKELEEKSCGYTIIA